MWNSGGNFIAKAKLAVEQKLITSCAEKWSKYYQVTIDTATGMAKIVGSPNINSTYDYKKFEESGEKEAWSAAQKAVIGIIINKIR